MRRLSGLTLVLGGIAFACLLVGMGSGSECAPGMGSDTCVGASPGGAGVWPAIAGAAAIGLGLLGASIVVQAHRHRRLAAALRGFAWPDRLAGHLVGLVPGIDAPFVAGLRRPLIYCPPDLDERLSEFEVRAVLLHERHHQASHAPARLVVLASISPVLRHLPAGRRWLEMRRAVIEIEADEYALMAGARRADLARALLKLGPFAFDPALPSYASASELRLRHLAGEQAGQVDARFGSLAPVVVAVAAFAMCLVQGVIH